MAYYTSALNLVKYLHSENVSSKQIIKSISAKLISPDLVKDLPMNLETSTMASRGSEKGKELKFEEMERSRPYVPKPSQCDMC